MRIARSCWVSWLWVCVALTCTAAQAREDTFEFGRFGTIHVVVPQGKITSVALLAADNVPWNEDAQTLARTLAQTGALVAGIDTSAYLKAAEDSDEYCTYVAGELEDLAHGVQKRYTIPNYLSPVLVGYGQGGGLWYSAVAQAPGGTFRALLTLGFCPTLNLRHRVCDGRVLKTVSSGTGTTFQPSDLKEIWVALNGAATRQCPISRAADFVARSPGAQLVPVQTAASRDNDRKQLQNAYQKLVNASQAKPLPAKVEDLPLIEIAAKEAASADHADQFAVIITGDGGWAGLDREVAAGFSQAGIPVVGLSSLKYFWQLRTPEQTALDLQRIIDYYSTTWHRERAILIGYSFGADVMPAVVNRLSADARSKIASINLLGLAEHASFEIHVTAWLGQYAQGPQIKPEVERIRTIPILCIRGDDEGDSLCPQLTQPNVRKLDLPGGHHFDGDYGRLVGEMLKERG